MQVATILAVLAAQTAVRAQPPEAKAFLEIPYQPIESLRELPPALAAAFRQHLYATPIADRGQPFRGGDVVMHPDPPVRRFLAAGTSPSGSFVAYEHGGLGQHYHLVLFGPEVPQPRRLVHCVGVNVFLDRPVRGPHGKRRPPSSREIQERLARDIKAGSCSAVAPDSDF